MGSDPVFQSKRQGNVLPSREEFLPKQEGKQQEAITNQNLGELRFQPVNPRAILDLLLGGRPQQSSGSLLSNIISLAMNNCGFDPRRHSPFTGGRPQTESTLKAEIALHAPTLDAARNEARKVFGS